MPLTIGCLETEELRAFKNFLQSNTMNTGKSVAEIQEIAWMAGFEAALDSASASVSQALIDGGKNIRQNYLDRIGK